MFPIRDDIPSNHLPLMSWALIGINAVAFLLELAVGPGELQRAFYLFGIVPARFIHPGWAESVGFPTTYWAFVTSMFLHGGWLHVIGNMWTLWIFGDNVEDRMGPFRFLGFYLVSGVAAGVVHTLSAPGSTVPTVGASGAIAGVMGAYFLMFPRSRILMFFPVFFYPLFFVIPAYVFLAYWFLIQFFQGTLSLAGAGTVGGVAFWAHVGGFLTGALVHPLFLSRRRRRRPPVIRIGSL